MKKNDEKYAEAIVPVLRALGDNTRFWIFCYVWEQEAGATLRDIAKELGVRSLTLKHHMNVLWAAKLLVSELPAGEDRDAIYKIPDDVIQRTTPKGRAAIAIVRDGVAVEFSVPS